jgi:hypothetical protein
MKLDAWAAYNFRHIPETQPTCIQPCWIGRESPRFGSLSQSRKPSVASQGPRPRWRHVHATRSAHTLKQPIWQNLAACWAMRGQRHRAFDTRNQLSAQPFQKYSGLWWRSSRLKKSAHGSKWHKGRIPFNRRDHGRRRRCYGPRLGREPCPLRYGRAAKLQTIPRHRRAAHNSVEPWRLPEEKATKFCTHSDHIWSNSQLD